MPELIDQLDHQGGGSSATWRQSSTVRTIIVILGAFAGTIALAGLVGEIRWYRGRATWFFLLLAIVFLVFSSEKYHRAVRTKMTSFARFLQRRGAFVSNPVQESPKFAILRFAFGFFIVERAGWILYYLTDSDWTKFTVWSLSLMCPVVGICIAFGLFTQFCLAFLVIFQWGVGDRLLGTATLGNNIGTTLAILLMLSNSGARFSLDARIMNSKGFLKKIISLFYYENGVSSADTLQIVKFMALFAYWCTCLYSLAMHLNEPAWMTGMAGPLLLTNNFMSRFSSEFSYLFSMGALPVVLARVSLWAMLPWYLLIVPFVVLGGWFRQYIIVWGVLFFCLSRFVLQLGWLAEFEFIFFAGLFWQKAFISGPKTLHVAYDDRCNLCDNTVRFVKFVDIFQRVELRPLSQNAGWLSEVGIDPNDASKDLYGVDISSDAPPAKGYDFYILLSRYVLLLLPAYPFLLLGSVLGGRGVYRFIADRRTRMFGVCQIPSKKVDYAAGYSVIRGDPSIGARDPIVPIFAHFSFFAIAFLIALPTPYLDSYKPAMISKVQEIFSKPARSVIFYGTTPINVFNETDLRMAENWFTISSVNSDGEVILPIINENGERLGGHRSDRLYFGNTVRIRRAMIGVDGCQFERFKASFDYLLEGFRTIDGTYIYRQYHQQLPDAHALQNGKYMPQQREVVCEAKFDPA